MSKKETTALATTGSNLPTTPNEDVLAILGQAEAQQFGKDDVSIAFLRVLQSGSPQVKKAKPEFIPGAEPGDFFHTVSKRVWKGEGEGLIVVPVAYTRSYTEWKPRGEQGGGGFVRDHGADDAILKQTTKGGKTGTKDVLPNGNEILFSMLYYVQIVDPETGELTAAAFPLASTQLKKGRAWNSVMQALRVSVNGQRIRPPMFYQSYRITTVPEQNDQGDWYGVKIEAFKPTHELPGGIVALQEALEFNKMISQGAVRVQQEAEDAEYEVEDESGI